MIINNESEPAVIFEQNDLNQLESDSTLKNVHLINCKWSDLKLRNLSFENCVFTDNHFGTSELEEAYFYRCRFSRCHFQHSHFNETTFDHCSFYDVKLDQGSDFSYSNLKFCKFLDCDLSQAKFKHADLFGISIKASKLIAAQLEQANFANKVSPKVIFAQAEIIDSILRFANCSKLHLANCNLSGNDCTEADFSYSNLEAADLKNCLLNETNFAHASLINAEIHGSELNNIDLSHCQLKGLKISIDQAIPFLDLFGIKVE